MNLPVPSARPYKPTAAVTIDPMGRRGMEPRDYTVRLVINLNERDPQFADKGQAAEAARQALAAFAPASGAVDRRGFGDVTVSTRSRKTGGVTSVVTGVEGSVVWSGRPDADAIETLRVVLVGKGYAVTIRERRECTESVCPTDALIAWNRLEDIPPSWYSPRICGKHDYRTCAKCRSVYRLTSMSAAGQAPAVHCAVCGGILVEWGSSKIWDAELIDRVEAVAR